MADQANLTRAMSIRTKLYLQAAGVLLGVSVLGYGAYRNIEHVKVTGPLYNSIIRDKDLLADVLPPPAYILEAYLVANQLAMESDEKVVAGLFARCAKLREEYTARKDYWRVELPDGPTKEKLISASDAYVQKFFNVFEGEYRAAISAGEREKATGLLRGPLTGAYEKHRDEIDQIVKAATASSSATEKETSAALQTGLFLLIGLAAIVGVLSATGCILIGRSIVRRLPALSKFADGLAAGDMTVQLGFKTDDEFGRLGTSLDSAAESMRGLVREVSGNASEVAGAATQIAAAAEEMSASVGEVARQAAQASESASRSGEMAVGGGEVVSRTVIEMKQIADAVNSTASSIQTLGERGQQIGRVIAVINDIADQTNLLALNAAIEAARAGEHGRGFAVVADEVRKLAERTTKATEEVATSIKAIQDETKVAVDRMGQGTKQVGEGVSLAGQAGQNLQQIVASANEVSGLIQAISAASAEAGAATSESAQAAQELSSKAERLRELMSRFKTEDKDRSQPGSGPKRTTGKRSPAKSAHG